MRFVQIIPCLALAVACGSCLAVAAQPSEAPGAFTLDKYTLLLAHFDDTARMADYANGWREFGGSGAGLTEGYFGRAIDLRGVQFQPDFMTTRDTPTPMFNDFGIWPRGNIDLYQGTLEFWFKVSPDKLRQNHIGQELFFTYYYQPDRPGELSSCVLTQKRFEIEWHTLSGDRIQGQVEFEPPLDPSQWHYLAMCWSQGEMVIYFDGRAALAWDMTGKLGPLLLSVAHKPLCINGVAMDELRISNVVRYSGDFEPRWRNGQRPPYAFRGMPGIKRYPAKTEDAYIPHVLTPPGEAIPLRVVLHDLSFTFDRNTGFVTSFGEAGQEETRGANGVLLWEGVERSPRLAAVASNWNQTSDALSFEQQYGDRIRLHHVLKSAPYGITWRVTFSNLTDHELWLEALMSLPMPMPVRQYFDMSYIQDQLSLPRRRDDYVFSLPLAAAAGEDRAIGLGIDPHTDLSALISEWIPENNSGTVRQGTRVVLDPRGSYSVDFVIFADGADFGVRNALDHYYSAYPDLYKQDPTVPIYSYMPVVRYFEEFPYPDLARLAYAGMQWGHGPDHLKGDEYGTMRYWHMPKDPTREDYQTLIRYESIWQSQEGLTQDRLRRSKLSYDSYYTLRRSHYLPNWAGTLIVEDLYPEGMKGGDPQITGQYYYPDMYYANECHTPLGKHYQQLTLEIMQQIGQYSPGFINDMCQTSPMRFTDDIARKTPGRAFARDRGTYLVGAFGHADRYRMINSFRDERGFRQSIWSDGGVVSYQLSALSAADVIESYIIPIDFTGVELGNQAGRNLLGEKPMVVHWSKESEWMGRFHQPSQFTPETLRDYYRYTNAQIMLSAFRTGVYLPYDCVEGQQELMEYNPMLVESIIYGRKAIPAATVPDPLVLRRGGEGMNTVLVVGNAEPRPIAATVSSANRYFDGQPIFGAYFGGTLRHRLGASTEITGVTFPPRSLTGFKLLGRLKGTAPAEVVSTFAGDGLTMQVDLYIQASQPADLELNTFAPIYRIRRVTLNGRDAGASSSIVLPAGESEVTVDYDTPVLAFSAADWDSVDLLAGGKANFCLVANTRSSFDAGTAGMLNAFLEQYDQEDGLLGNLAAVPVQDVAPQGFPGWRIFVRSDAPVTPSHVRIDRNVRSIYIEGRSPGEARRAMVVFLRLVDRKYPHIGRYYRLRSDLKEPWEAIEDEYTRGFFAQFPDRQWLNKPILRPELEGIYRNDNENFEGKYQLRVSPYILEPTYSDGYVYGYGSENRCQPSG